MEAKQFLFGSLPESTSESGSLNKTDLLKSARLLVVVVAGAAATAGINFVANWLTGADFGPYQLIIMPFASALLEVCRKLVADHLHNQ